MLYNAIKGIFEQTAYDFELIFSNDGSTDSTAEVLRKLAQTDTRVKYIFLSRNFGQQAALTAGLDHASGDAVITMDCDLQDPPELIPDMLKKWKEGAEIVYTRRKVRKDKFLKRTTASLYYKLLSRFSDIKIGGDIGDFRLIDKKVHKELINMREKARYLRGMVYWMGYDSAIIDFVRPLRKEGKTGFSLLKMVRLAMHGILNFSLLPLRIGLILGVVTIFTGIFFLIYITIDTLVFDKVYMLYKWLSVVTFLMVGFLFILIWIMGEYIGKIYAESKDRPIYLANRKGNLE